MEVKRFHDQSDKNEGQGRILCGNDILEVNGLGFELGQFLMD